MINRFFVNKVFSLKQKFCKTQIMKNKNLFNEIMLFKKNDISKHVSWITIFQLYNYILKKKPKKILELGSGLSTLIILVAINNIKNIYPKYNPIFVSMENNKKYYLNTKKKIPKYYKNKVKLVLSKIIKDNFLLFSGYRYLNVPKMKYDFIFVDGPNYKDQDGMSCSFDVIFILKNFTNYFDCIIEKRLSTVYIMQKLLGKKAVKLSFVNRTSFLKVNINDLKTNLDSQVFKKSFFNNIYFTGYY